MEGKLIILEGIDGAGKSTQVKLVKEYLESKGKKVEVSREPTHGLWGSKFLTAIKEGKKLSMAETIDILMLDRTFHVEAKLRPALNAGLWVLLDRYWPSMVAYQGAEGADTEDLIERNRKIAPEPDLAIYISLPTEEAIRRIHQRQKVVTELESAEYLEKVAEIYATFTRFPWWQRVNGEGSEAEVYSRVHSLLHLKFPEL